MSRRQFARRERREGAVEQSKQDHRGEAHEVDMGMQMRLIEALVDADPNAEGKAEGAVKKAKPKVPYKRPIMMNHRSTFFMSFPP
jgi:hypothetical protein